VHVATQDAIDLHRKPGAERAAPAHLDRVAQHLAAAGFADEAIVDLHAALKQGLHHPHRAIDGDAFLVAGDQEAESARRPAAAAEAFRRGDHGRQTALHVGSATAVQIAVALAR